MADIMDLGAATAPSASPGGGGLPGNALNSSIPADITKLPAPSVGQPADLGGSIGTMEAFARTQGQLNQNKLFAQTYAARQKAGEIMASAPDMDTAIQRLMQDPITAPFAGDTLNSIRQANQALALTQGEQQKQAQSGLEAVIKGLGGVMADPSQWDKIMKAQLSVLSPSARASVAPAVDSLKSALYDGLPSDPQQARMVFNQRVAGLWLGSGITPDQIGALVGKPSIVDSGGVKRPVVQLPPQLGGGLTSSGQQIPNTLAPTVATGPGSVPMVLGGGGNGGGMGGGMGGSPPNVMAMPRPRTGGNPASPLAQTPTPVAGDGNPLMPPSVAASSTPRGVGGLPLLSANQLEISKGLADEFAGPEKKAFENANATMGLLQEMDRDFDTMAKGGGWMVPGAGAQFRGSAAKVLNTISQMTGSGPVVDPSKMASFENLMKDTRRMGLTVLTTMLGNQREAATTIQNITQAVPDVSNTYLGGKLLIQSIKASTQRAIDQRNFENQWQQSHSGDLTGAVEAFNKAHPADAYAKQVLDNFGLTEKGFSSPKAVIQAVQQGYLTKTQASKILKDQFPNVKPGQ